MTPCDLSAVEARRLIDTKALSPVELMESCLARIEAVNGAINAIVTLDADGALAAARAAEAAIMRGDSLGSLSGLPVAIKDLEAVAGLRFTQGSLIHKDDVPTADSPAVARLRAAGAIVFAKTNTPEFGAGANTFNEVFGATRNPWNTALSCAGSSGGSAVAVATGEAWLADGDDLGGSLRTPAAFCGVVGLRPSPGRVPVGDHRSRFQTLDVRGPLARDVRDCALMLDAMAGFDPHDPLSFDAPVVPFREAVEQRPALRRVAFSSDLGGITPVDAEVARICAAAAASFERLGVEVVEASPDLGAAVATFTTLRAALYAERHEPLLTAHRDLLKPEIVWNTEAGLALDAAAIGAAARARTSLQQAMACFLDDHDLFLCPAAICPPYPVEQRYVEAVNGHRFASYIDWVSCAFAITLTGAPALSLPAGLNSAGLPVGLQIVGPHRGEALVLSAAAWLEDTIGRLIDGVLQPRGEA